MDTFIVIAFFGFKMDTLQLFYFILKMMDTFYLLTRRVLSLKTYGAAIENVKLHGKVGFALILFSCLNATIAIIIDFILQLNEVDCTIIYAYRKDGIQFSIHSENV